MKSNILKLPLEDYYIQVVCEGNIVSYKDLEISLITRGVNKDLYQVYKRSYKTTNKSGKTIFVEYNNLHYNCINAVREFLQLRGSI